MMVFSGSDSTRRAGRPNSPDGIYLIPYTRGKRPELLRVIASSGLGWEHVSVSLKAGLPTWDMMCLIKDLFWEEEDCVVQYHPPRSDYVNCHPRVLHLWKPVGYDLPRPPSELVGPKNETINL